MYINRSTAFSVTLHLCVHVHYFFLAQSPSDTQPCLQTLASQLTAFSFPLPTSPGVVGREMTMWNPAILQRGTKVRDGIKIAHQLSLLGRAEHLQLPW